MGFSADEYRQHLAALLPPGPAWDVAPGGALDRLLGALAEEFARADARAGDLRAEIYPPGASALLQDWERVAGLPDACTSASATLAERRQAVARRIAEDGDVTGGGWVERAAALGHNVTLREFTPSWCGQFQCGQPLQPHECVFVLEITAPTVVTHPFQAGGSAAGEALGGFDTDRLRCELERVRQAHTHLLFNFTT